MSHRCNCHLYVPVPWRRDDDKIQIIPGGQRLEVMIALGIKFGRLLPGLYHQRLRKLSLLPHDIADGKNTGVSGEQIFKQAGPPSTDADHADPGIDRGELYSDHAGCLRLRRLCVQLLLEAQSNRCHAAKSKEISTRQTFRGIG